MKKKFFILITLLLLSSFTFSGRKCPMCPNYSFEGKERCEHCNYLLDAPPVPSPLQPDEIPASRTAVQNQVCSHCTFENSKHVNECEMCGNSLSSPSATSAALPDQEGTYLWHVTNRICLDCTQHHNREKSNLICPQCFEFRNLNPQIAEMRTVRLKQIRMNEIQAMGKCNISFVEENVINPLHEYQGHVLKGLI